MANDSTPSPPWISVADRLPDITESYPDSSKPVLARTKSGNSVVAMLCRSDDFDEPAKIWRNAFGLDYRIDGIVDWMPLP